MIDIDKLKPLDANSAVQSTIHSRGWKILRAHWQLTGDELMSKLMSLETKPGQVFTERDLYAHKLSVMADMLRVPGDIEETAQADNANKKGAVDAKV